MKGLVLISSVFVAICTASWLEPAAQANHLTKCFGELADENRSHDPGGSFLIETAGHDVVIGSEFGDHIEGRDGRDFLCGIGGGDELLGGRKADKLSGGAGRDDLFGGRGNDLLKGGAGRDHGSGGPGWDTCVNIEVRTSCEVVR